jgi:protein TonB
MRWAVPASIAVHVGLVAGAWLLLQLRPEDPSSAEAAVSVSIIEMQDAVTEPSETVSEATANLVSSGMTQAAAEPEPVEEVAETEPVQVTQAQPAQPAASAAAVPVTEAVAPAETEELVSAQVMTALSVTEAPIAAPIPHLMSDAAPVVADSVAPGDTKVIERLDQAAKLAALTPAPEVQDITTASVSPPAPANPVESTQPVKIANLTSGLEPVAEGVVETPPVPAPRIVRKPVEAEEKPVKDKKPIEKKKAEKPLEKPVEKKKTKQVASLGNGGENEADSAAAKAAGGKQGKVSAEGGNAAAYAGKVRAKVLKSLRAPSGSYDGGEVRVAFTIDASGRLVSSWLSRSSGDDKVDKAALAAVKRAAPFPSFSDGGSRSFTFPLMIQ